MAAQNSVVSRDGVVMPGIIYGTAWKKDRTQVLVEEALALGFRGVDTACQPKHYHEPGVGEALAACCGRGLVKRGEVYVQTKFTPLDGHDPLRIPYHADAPVSEQVIESCAVSLRNLKTDYLDGLVLHSPLPDAADFLAVWRAMEGLVQQGLVRQLGLSNCYSLPKLAFLFGQAKIKPAVIQNRFYATTGYDREIRAFCTQHQIIYQSFWTLTANPQLLQHPAVLALAGQYGRTAAQIFFRYLQHLGIIPLTGTTSSQHMREDLALAEFNLAADECSALAGIF